jgi:arginine utilization regulatory protein
MNMHKGIPLSFYQTIMDSTDVGIHAIDHNGKTILYNKQMMHIEGMEIEDVLDKNILEVFQFNQGENSTLLKVLKTGTPIYNSKQKYFNNKGQEINTVSHTLPVKEGHNVIGAIELVKDVTKYEKMALDYHKSAIFGPEFELLFYDGIFPADILEAAKQAASSQYSVLITGEEGTGIDTIAEFILLESDKSERGSFRQSCASLPEIYLEEVLFAADGKGLLTEAAGCSLLLEEIQELSIPLQQKLLTYLENPAVSEHEGVPARPRIIATMSQDPFDAIAEQKLLKELYYRISETALRVPPLRERKTGIAGVCSYFIKKFNQFFNMDVLGVSEEVKGIFHSYAWPGNIKEAEQIIQDSMLVMDREEKIELHHLPMHFRQKVHQESDFLIQKNREIMPLEEYLQETEKYYIQKALQYHKFNITQAAKALHMSRQNLQYRIRKFGLKA